MGSLVNEAIMLARNPEENKRTREQENKRTREQENKSKQKKKRDELHCIEQLHRSVASFSCIVQSGTFGGFNGHFHSVLQHGHWKIFRGVRRAPQTVIDVASGGQGFFHDL
jgi:hypothetical protein